MRNFLYIIVVFFAVSGCKPGIPKDIIQPDEMALVLHDIHLADGYINTLNVPDSVKIIAASYYKGIYKKYGIDSAMYTRSMAYYYNDPKALNGIYIKVTEALTKERNVIVKADSLQNVRVVAKLRFNMIRDSTRKADSTFWANVLLRDTSKVDTLKEKINIIRLKMDYKGPAHLK